MSGFHGYALVLALAVCAALMACGALLAGCDKFVGPATEMPPCPIACGHDDAGAQMCCTFKEVCDRQLGHSEPRYADRPCVPAELPGAARDAGADR